MFSVTGFENKPGLTYFLGGSNLASHCRYIFLFFNWLGMVLVVLNATFCTAGRDVLSCCFSLKILR
jgi:hypothetical protein